MNPGEHRGPEGSSFARIEFPPSRTREGHKNICVSLRAFAANKEIPMPVCGENTGGGVHLGVQCGWHVTGPCGRGVKARRAAGRRKGKRLASASALFERVGIRRLGAPVSGAQLLRDVKLAQKR